MTFLERKGQARFGPEREYSADIFDVSCNLLAVDNDVIDLNEGGLPLKTTENLVHTALKDGRSVSQAGRHTLVLVEIPVSPEGGLLSVFGCKFNLVESFVGVDCVK